ncbi:hypothetical protein Fmac_005027 [Flemingia macrophylla]|uniref:Pentatricopeptide repeat-containing protein n=1 Tax=Flemingia macrophylla TaxID=520843 RepID=A0ABD1N7L8_9FABA
MNHRNTVTWNSMISGYVQRREISRRKLFDEMPQRDIVSWNLIVSGYFSCHGSRFVEEGRRLFDLMPQRDSVSWNTVISGYAKNGRMDQALKVFNAMPERNVVSSNAVITGFLLNGDVMSARSGGGSSGTLIPDDQGDAGDGQRKFKRNVVSWNSMMMCYVKAGDIVSARELFDRMVERDTCSWNTVISGYVQISNMEEDSKLFREMPSPDVLSWNLMISGFAQKGVVNLAKKFFERIPNKNLISWNSIIAGCEKNEDYKGAIQLFSRMQVDGERPDRHTLSSVLSVSTGLVDLYLGLVDEGRRQFKSMVDDYGIEPRVEHFASLVDILERQGQLQEALDLINTMPLKSDTAVWGALLGACRMHNNVELALVAFDALIKLEPESSAPYVLLYNMYANIGQWDDAENVRVKMEDKNVKKQAGYSWVDS